MAVSTQDQRASLFNFGLPIYSYGPVPDGSFDATDRQSWVGLYAKTQALSSTLDTVALTPLATTVNFGAAIYGGTDAVTIASYAATVAISYNIDNSRGQFVGLGLSFLKIFPDPDGSISQSDRAQFVGITRQVGSSVNISASFDEIAVGPYAATITDEFTNTWFNNTWFDQGWFNSSWFDTQASAFVNATTDTVVIVSYAATVFSGADVNINAGFDAVTITAYNPAVRADDNLVYVLNAGQLTVTKYNTFVRNNILVRTSLDRININGKAATVRISTGDWDKSTDNTGIWTKLSDNSDNWTKH